MVEPVGTFRNTMRSARHRENLTVEGVLYGMDLFGCPISERSYYRYEHGQVYPPVNVAQALSFVLQTSINRLWPNDLSLGDRYE
jgi:transcriptional regulator with XRE-family HTH domain